MQIFVREPWSARSLLIPVDDRLTVRLFKRKAMAALGGAGAPPPLATPSSSPPQSCAECLLDDDVSLCYGGKRLQEEVVLRCGGVVENLSTVELRLPLRGGGGDGGATGAESRDCYLKMYAEKKPDKVDPNDSRRAKWSRCCLTSEDLQPPCAIDYLGNLFNKESVVRALVEKSLPSGLRHIQSLKDIITIRLTDNTGNVGREAVEENRFCCPIAGVDFNGMFKFVAFAGCGHVLSSRALKELKATTCPVCSKPFEETDQIVINGSEEEVRVLRNRLQERKEKMKMTRKEKKKKRREGREEEEEAITLCDKDRGEGGGQSCEMEDKAARAVQDATSLLMKKSHGGFAVVPAAVTAGDLHSNGKAGSKGGGGERGKAVVIAPPAKRFKAVDKLPQHATKEVYASIFNSSVRTDAVPETYSCRSLPIGRN